MKKFICLIAVILLCSGCVIKEEYSIGVNKDKSVDLNLVMAFDNELLDFLLSEGQENYQTFTDEERLNFLKELVKEMNNENSDKSIVSTGYTAYLYNESDSKGFRLVGGVDNIDNLVSPDANVYLEDLTDISINDLKLFTQNEDIYSLKLSLNSSDNDVDISGEMGDLGEEQINIKLVVTLPNEAESNNATSISEESHTYTWDLSNFNENNIVLDFKIKTIPWDYILIGGGIFIALVFLILALSFMKKKGKIDVSKMPKSVGNTNTDVSSVNNLEVINPNNANNNVDNLNVVNNQINNDKVESIETLNIDEKLVDSLNIPIGNTEEVESLAMVDTFKSTETPIDKNNPTQPQFSFDNPDNNAAANYPQNNKTNNENNNLQ